ncbi:MAG: ATP-dependent DNA helicase [Acidobacteriota bacterium]|nr:ATP-dependent DNA helicase [Acidobacteriota bacterium]
MQGSGQRKFEPTEQQRRAIEHLRGPILVVAGAGTGKTTVLAHRIAHLIHSGNAQPNEILAVTYTRNAAAELIGRVAKLLYPNLSSQKAASRLMASGLEANTFHAYCHGLLHINGVKFELVHEQDVYVYLRRRITDLKLKYFVESANLGKFLNDLLNFFRRCQDELRTPDDYDAYVARVMRGEIPMPRVVKSKRAEAMPDEEVLGRCREIARAYRQIEAMLRRDGLGTFGHIITKAVDVLDRGGPVLERARKRARFVLIDEFQDSNVAQIRLAELLGGEEANVFAVGDPDQGIYRFRGASSEAFDQFLRMFGSDRVKRVTMSENRRSTPPILRCAYQAIRCNPEVGSGEIAGGGWPREPLSCARLEREPQLEHAAPVQCVAYQEGEQQEAEFVADKIENLRLQRPGMKLNDIAVLYAQHNHRNEVLRELWRREIPVQVKGVNLLDTTEIRDALAVLRILDAFDPVAIIRAAALPHFEVDPEDFRAQMALAGRDPVPEAVLENVGNSAELRRSIREARRELTDAGGKVTAALKIARRWFQLPDSLPLQCLAEFTDIWLNKPKAISGEGSLHEFLDYLQLYCEAGGVLAENNEDSDPVKALAPRDVGEEPKNAVQMMTIHSVKGLEFPYVFVLRVKSSSLPAQYHEPLVEFPRELRNFAAADDDDAKKPHGEEQRRLFYVAMTRAEDELYLSGKAGKDKKQPAPPSIYLRELVDCATTALRGAVQNTLLPLPVIPAIHASAEPLPNISHWVQLPPRATNGVPKLSASAIDHYDRCPLAYKLRYDWNIPERASAALQYGNAMHQALKAYFDGVKAGRAQDEATVVACFLDEFGKASIVEDEQRRRYEQDGREQLVRFLRSPLAQPRGEILENEKQFTVVIGGTKVRGRIDRLERTEDGQMRIIDYKTGAAKTEEDADKSMQLSIYALAAKSEKLHAASLVFVNLRDNTLAETSRTEEQLRSAESKVIDVARRIADGEFEPKPGRACRNCSYHSICPAQEMVISTPSAVAPEVAADQALLPFPN